MARIRNDLSHSGAIELIDKSDITFMATTLQSAISAYCNTRRKYEIEDLKFIMDQAFDVGLLRKEAAWSKRRAELLAAIIKWRSKRPPLDAT